MVTSSFRQIKFARGRETTNMKRNVIKVIIIIFKWNMLDDMCNIFAENCIHGDLSNEKSSFFSLTQFYSLVKVVGDHNLYEPTQCLS